MELQDALQEDSDVADQEMALDRIFSSSLSISKKKLVQSKYVLSVEMP